MDYLKIILEGYLNDDNKASLDNYFVIEYKKAERDNFIDDTEFFSGLERVIRKIKGEVNSKFNKRKSELNFMLQAAHNKTITYNNPDPLKTIEELHKETIISLTRKIDLLDLNDFSYFHEGASGTRDSECLYYNQIEHIEKSILAAKSNVILLKLGFNGHHNLPKTLKTKLTTEKASILFVWLKVNGFISKEADGESFLWIFVGEHKPKCFYPVEWIPSKQLLRELVIPLRHNLTVTEVEKIVPLNFIKKGKPLKLAKAKRVLSQDSDKLKEFLATL